MSATVAARTGVAAGGWQEAIRAACQPLLSAGAIHERYIDACIDLVEEEGPYMVVAPGIALAHARPEDGVLSLGVAVAVLADPVEFGHPDNDPVDLVFAFGSPDADQHVGLLGALARGLTSGLDDELRGAGDQEGATATLRKQLEGAT
ncbi:MAG: PTS sugar transporter subunit IIA [Actinomycetota bacterium]